MCPVFAITVVTLMISALSTADSDHNTPSYVIMAPKVLRRGSDFKVSVSILKSSADVSVTVQILDSQNGTVVQNSSTIRTGSTTNIVLYIPQNLKANSFQLFVYATGGLQFEQLATLDAVSKTLSLFVQTDKALYKPGQKVLYRAITMYPNLMPFKGPVDISMYDVAGNKIVQLSKKTNETGVIGGELLLSDQTPLGVWKVKVEAGGNVVERNFEVAEYVLPKFKVTVDLPSYYFVNSKQQSVQSPLSLTITAKYTYGQPVKGQVNIAVQLAPYAWDNAKYPQKLLSATLTNGRYDVNLPLNDLLQLIPSEQVYRDRLSVLPYRSLLVIANVTEMATGKTFSSNATVPCRDRRYEIKFLEMSPDSYKSGMVYTGFMQLSQVDGSPPLPSDVGSLVTLTVTTFLQNSDTITQKFDITVTESGLMSFTLNIAHSNNANVQLQASYKEQSMDVDAMAFKSLMKFESRDNESIQLSFASDDGIIRAGEVLTFRVKLSVPLESYSYQILAKGTIVSGDTVIKSSPSVDHQFQLTFSESVTRVLMPSARIVTWAITKAGEIISDSIEVNIATSFANNVSLSFNKGQVEPGEQISLVVNAQQGSYIGLLAVDQSVRLLKTGNDVTQDMVFDELKRYDSSSKYGSGQRRDKRCLLWPVFSGGQDTSEVFDNAGLVVITDAYIFKRDNQFYPFHHLEMMNAQDVVDDADMAVQANQRPRLMFKSASLGSSGPAPQLQTAQPRVEFPETWLWSDAVADSNGSVSIKLTVPDTITSWVASAFAVSSYAGFGVAASNAHLTVFKPFFVSLNLPYSIVRGEEFALKVTVFNYLATEVSVRVTLRKSTDFRVRHINAVEPEEIELTDTVSLAANDAQTVYFWIVPDSLGQIPIEVHAQSPAAADAERKLLLVKPEGVSQEYSTSLFIDLSKGGSYSSTLDISLPPTGVVPGSQHIEFTAIGDLLGPSINGLDSLIKMPYGCGEQNMLNFAPNIYIMNYLTSTSQLTSDAADKSQRYMLAGYQRELTYQRNDGSFSAFGNSDPAGSVWLSAFVAKCFHEAKDYIPVEGKKIADTLNWIIKSASTSGAFAEPSNGKVIHTDMQGGSSKGVALTAYVLIALLENNETNDIERAQFKTVIDQARVFLESNLGSIRSDPYAASIITYALSLAGSARATSAFDILNSLAIVRNGLMHWEKPEAIVASKNGFWQPPYSQSRAVNVEMTSYALLTYALRRDVPGGVPIAKWIVSQRNSNGGFSSTQDTVVALQALAAFASLTTLPSGGDSEIRISATFGQSTHHFLPITRESALLLQTAEIPTDVNQVEIAANGNGVGLVQLNVKFNKYEVNKATAGISLTVSTDQKDNVVSLISCGRWTSTEQPSGMVVMDISQLTGFTAINVDKLKEDLNDRGLKRVENDDERLVLYFDELTGENTCVTIQSEKVRMVSNIQKAAVKLYSYYDPGSVDTAFYLPPEASAQTNDLCSSCPQCCGIPEPRQIQHSGGARVVTMTTFVGFLMTLTIASLLSCLLFA